MTSTASPEEIARFTAMAEEWWDPHGKFRPLHRFNPVRIGFLVEHLARQFGRDPEAEAPFAGLSLLDVGCGGGLLAEPLRRLGFTVTGIDAGERNIAVAKIHADKVGLEMDYRVATPEELSGESFDVVLIMEILEHVTDVEAFLAAVAGLLKPGGALFAATLNRTIKAYALGIVGAEYLLRWLPPGTHNWKKFLKPSELANGLRRNGITVRDLKGMSYDPVTTEWKQTGDLSVNYMGYAVKA
jgi:2-polyprenyl-6-hydroxyphenyl methylase/3-demethylubiquinone-9 3-methyltransferase